MEMKDFTEIKIPSHPKYLAVVRSTADMMGELYGMTESEKSDVVHAVDEACSNVIKYACKGDPGQKIVVKFKLHKKQFEVVIEDNGIKADPAVIKGRDLADVRPGGLGVHLIKKAFDVFAFDDKKIKGNRLRLIRYRKENSNNNED